MIQIDVCDLSCPIPIVKTKKAMEQNPNEKIEVILNNTVSKENISRFAENKGYKIKEEIIGDNIKLILTP